MVAEAVMVHSPTATVIAKSNLVDYSVDIGGLETGCTHDSRLHSKGLDNRWTGMPFTNSCSVNETSAFNTQKLDYNLVYILSFRELHQWAIQLSHIPFRTRTCPQNFISSYIETREAFPPNFTAVTQIN